MRETAHLAFLRWGAWVLEPVAGDSLGYGKNILLEILEGKGVILPKAPPGSGRKAITVSLEASKVDLFVRGLGGSDRKIIRTFYLNPNMTVEDRAQRCGMLRRTMYNHIDRIHGIYLLELGEKNLL